MKEAFVDKESIEGFGGPKSNNFFGTTSENFHVISTRRTITKLLSVPS